MEMRVEGRKGTMSRRTRRDMPAWAVQAAALLGAGLLVAALVVAIPASGQGLPALPGLNGGSLSQGDLANGTTILVVWASWSPRCRDIVPRVNDLAGAVSGKGRVVTVNFQEERPAVEAFLAGKSLSAPVYLDASGDFSKAHAVTTLPGLIVYRGGQVRYQGRLESDAAAQVEKILQ
jgi:thiol-disulfide isomerase/thioredoxin